MTSIKATAMILAAVTACTIMLAQEPQTPSRRRMTPVNTPATATQPINETKNDTARINEARRARSIQYQDDNGNTIYVDTITGEQWRDSTEIKEGKPRIQYPLFESASVGINIWDPIMRAFGQHYGLIEFAGEVSLLNRFKPVFEVGLGKADNTPDDQNFTYKSPLSIYFRIGANYNFMYKSSTDYQFFGGLRYGFSPFSYSLTDISINTSYWDESAYFDIPSQNATVGWLEIALGLRVRLWGPISAGWTFKYRHILHESKYDFGEPWYIPGFGSRNSSVGGAFTIYYTLPIGRRSPAEIPEDVEATTAKQ